MRPYLPREGMSSSPYSEGGALYALGLMYSNYDQSNKAFLLQSLRDSSSEVYDSALSLCWGVLCSGPLLRGMLFTCTTQVEQWDTQEFSPHSLNP